MTRMHLPRRCGLFIFGMLLALGLLAPQAVGANKAPSNPALNPAVVPDLSFMVACAPSGGQISGTSFELETNQQGQPVFRIEFYTQKDAKATVTYRKHGSNGLWTYAYQHFSDDTDHIFFTNGLAAGTQYDFVVTTSQCGNVVDTQPFQYGTL